MQLGCALICSGGVQAEDAAPEMETTAARYQLT
jgi:hypothetical protein